MVEALSHRPKGHGSDSWSGHIHAWVVGLVLVGMRMKGNQSMFLSRIDASLPHSPSLLSLKKNKGPEEETEQGLRTECHTWPAHRSNFHSKSANSTAETQVQGSMFRGDGWKQEHLHIRHSQVWPQRRVCVPPSVRRGMAGHGEALLREGELSILGGEREAAD